jgi:hypothetical protein
MLLFLIFIKRTIVIKVAQPTLQKCIDICTFSFTLFFMKLVLLPPQNFARRACWHSSSQNSYIIHMRRYSIVLYLYSIPRKKYLLVLSHVWLQTEFGLGIGCIEHLKIVTTGNYNTLANSCTRLLTKAHTKSSQFVFTSRFLVTDPNNVLYLQLNCILFPLITPRHGPRNKIPFPFVVVQSLSWENVCLRSRYSVTAAVYLLIPRSLSSRGRCL